MAMRLRGPSQGAAVFEAGIGCEAKGVSLEGDQSFWLVIMECRCGVRQSPRAGRAWQWGVRAPPPPARASARCSTCSSSLFIFSPSFSFENSPYNTIQ